MKTEVHAPGFHAFAQQPLFNARCRAMISLCDNGLSQQTAFLLRNAAVPELFAGGSGLLENDVVRAALDDGGSGNERDLRLLLELRNGERAAVAHGRADLAQRQAEVVLQRACVRNIGVNARSR